MERAIVRSLRRNTAYFFLVLAAVIFLTPVLWLLLTSVKREVEYLSWPVRFLPAVPQWVNYRLAVTMGNFQRYATNSVILSASYTTLVVVSSALAGGRPRTLVGFENHSGRTYLGSRVRPLGEVRIGYGNNGEDGYEGAVYCNTIGTYLHGSLLPKNPWLADWLITRALARRYGETGPLAPLDDRLEEAAHEAAVAHTENLAREEGRPIRIRRRLVSGARRTR